MLKSLYDTILRNPRFFSGITQNAFTVCKHSSPLLGYILDFTGDRVVVVEDIVTTGSSILETVKVLESVGLKVRMKHICRKVNWNDKRNNFAFNGSFSP